MPTNYHSHHSPFGAFASFTLGLHHAPGGFGIALGAPAAQNIYVGWRAKGDAAWRLMPFFKSAESLLATFIGGEPTQAGAAAGRHYEIIAESEITRELGWASDTWKAGPLTFTIHTPFDHVSDPRTFDPGQARFFTAPVLAATLAYDNSAGGSEIEVIFGMNEPAQPMRPLADADARLAGFATGRRYGFATRPGEHVRAVQGLSVLNLEFRDEAGLHRIGAEAALIASVAAGAESSVPLALGFYEAGIVTTGIECAYFYTRHFDSLEDVLGHGLERHADYVAVAEKRDAELAASALTQEQRWLLAQATHSYQGSTELLTRNGEPLWVVNEGEYRMLNTFDLTVDHLFYELEWHPWAMRDALDLFVESYSHRDTIHSPEGARGEGGISFTHDMGVANQFSPATRSSYECRDLHGCFSHMTMEQLVNWTLCAVTYAEKTGDADWLRARRDTLLACRESMEQRDDPDPARRTGIMKWDSDRCGDAGSEITTYDSLDVSLGQARNNLYLAVKTLAAWLLLERAFRQLGDEEESARAGRAADLTARTLTGLFDGDAGFFPAVFEKGNRSCILPAVEGLVFPLYLGMDDVLARDGRFGELLGQLERHMSFALRPGVCLEPLNGGWKVSSTSYNTWMSKIAIAQHVTRTLFPTAMSEEAARADAAHVAWELNPSCAAYAMCDQIHCETGVAIGSRYYPRIVTACLWLRE